MNTNVLHGRKETIGSHTRRAAGNIVFRLDHHPSMAYTFAPLVMTGDDGYLDLWGNTTLTFCKDKEAQAICSIFTSKDLRNRTVIFQEALVSYNLAFDAGAQAIIAASAGTPITLIKDMNENSRGLAFDCGHASILGCSFRFRAVHLAPL